MRRGQKRSGGPSRTAARWSGAGLFSGLLGVLLLATAGVAAFGRMDWIVSMARSGRYLPFRALAFDALPISLTIAGAAMVVLTVWRFFRRTSRDSGQKPLRLGVIVLVCASALWAGYKLGYENMMLMSEDFPSYYFAGSMVASGEDPYDKLALRQLATTQLTAELRALHQRIGLPAPRVGYEGRVFPYLYPPLTAVLVAPLSLLGYVVAEQLWTALNLLALAGLVALTTRFARRRSAALVAVAVLLLLFQPLVRNAYTGQINLWVALAAWGGFALDRRGRWLGGGSCLALAAHLKFSPVLLIAYFAVRRRWKTVAAALGCGVLLLVGTWIACGGATLGRFVWEVLPQYSYVGKLHLPADLRPEALVLPNNDDPVTAYFDYPRVRVINQAPIAFVGMLATKAGLSGQSAVRTTQLLLALLWALTCWQFWQRRGDGGALSFAAATVLVLLTGPLLWQHHLVWLIVPFALLAGWSWQRAEWPFALAAIVAFVLTAHHYGYTPFGLPRDVPYSYGQLAGLLLLWGTLWGLGWREGGDESSGLSSRTKRHMRVA
ncbi:MAG: DUF2029 domain-containing protein [Acidobacteriota bacterium]|nr:MAG: DUF2029 domain-containing protein [Acidobacteriota bacterium]